MLAGFFAENNEQYGEDGNELPGDRSGQNRKNINGIAKENGYSADKIRDVLGISDRSNVYKWFRGQVLSTIDNLLAMSILFGVTINELIVTENREKAA